MDVSTRDNPYLITTHLHPALTGSLGSALPPGVAAGTELLFSAGFCIYLPFILPYALFVRNSLLTVMGDCQDMFMFLEHVN